MINITIRPAKEIKDISISLKLGESDKQLLDILTEFYDYNQSKMIRYLIQKEGKELGYEI